MTTVKDRIEEALSACLDMADVREAFKMEAENQIEGFLENMAENAVEEVLTELDLNI